MLPDARAEWEIHELRKIFHISALRGEGLAVNYLQENRKSNPFRCKDSQNILKLLTLVHIPEGLAMLVYLYDK